MTKMVKKSVLPLYLTAAVCLAWAILGSLYRLSDYLLCAVACVVVFIAAKAIWPDKTYETAAQDAPAAKKAPAKAEKKSTGDPELDKLVEQKDLAISELRRLNATIMDEKVSGQIDHLETVTEKIISHVVENPQKKSRISRFMSYYLPTTLKLLNAYDRMDDAGVSGVNIDTTKGKIETMMDTVTAAFDKQLDALFGDVAMDISTDITVMENLLAQEGLSSDAKTTQDGSGGITLEI